MNPTTVIINNKPFHLDDSMVTPDQLRALVNLPGDYEVWKIVGSPDPEGQLPTNDVQVTGVIEVKSGDRFRVVPPGTFGTAGRTTGWTDHHLPSSSTGSARASASPSAPVKASAARSTGGKFIGAQ